MKLGIITLILAILPDIALATTPCRRGYRVELLTTPQDNQLVISVESCRRRGAWPKDLSRARLESKKIRLEILRRLAHEIKNKGVRE